MFYEQKIKLNNMINKIKDKNTLIEIFKVVSIDIYNNGEPKYTYNNNGIYFDLNILSNTTLYAIENIVNNTIYSVESESIKYTLYSQDENDYNVTKLSNKEKNLIATQKDKL